MKADRFGPPGEVLRLSEREWGPPPKGCLLVKVDACGTGLPDRLMTMGMYPLISKPPVTPGQEVAGTVVAISEGSIFSVGDRVMGFTEMNSDLTFGGMADYACLREALTLRVPDTLSMEEAAGFPVAFRTAYAGLVERMSVGSGEVLVVLGGAGSSGVAAIVLGKAIGATVIAVAGNDEKIEFCRNIGADHALSYRSGDVVQTILDLTDGWGADAIFDPVGGDTGTKFLTAIARFGRFGMVGFAGGRWPTLDPLDMVLRSYSAVGIFGGAFTAEEDRAACDALFALAETGKIRPPIGQIYSLEDAAAAIDAMSNPPAGKQVVRVRP